MRVGIKYCGGCNPTYRRESIEEELIEIFGSENIVYTSSCEDVDVLVVICGCKTACISREIKCKNLIVVDEPKSKEELMEILSSFKPKMRW